MRSSKTQIIEAIFNARWNQQTQQLNNPIVTLQEVASAIRDFSHKDAELQLSANNPANFFKDLTRNRERANINWPESVFKRGFTARQLTGGGLCFEFIKAAQGQTEPFPLSIAAPSDTTPRQRITSVVLPAASRGRADEPWLLQIVVRLRIVETHMALFSPRRSRLLQVDHLQNSVKLRKSEIDAIFLGLEEDDHGQSRQFLITCEVKQRREDFSDAQLLRQPIAAFETDTVKQNIVVPIGIRAIGPSQIHLIEFSAILREDAGTTTLLTKASDAVYSLEPPVPGIGA
jgi:hypothetical protein